MSGRKHLHSIGSGKKTFQYAAMEGAGLPRRFPPKKKKTALGATNTEGGKAEQSFTTPVSASNINENGGFVK